MNVPGTVPGSREGPTTEGTAGCGLKWGGGGTCKMWPAPTKLGKEHHFWSQAGRVLFRQAAATVQNTSTRTAAHGLLTPQSEAGYCTCIHQITAPKRSEHSAFRGKATGPSSHGHCLQTQTVGHPWANDPLVLTLLYCPHLGFIPY